MAKRKEIDSDDDNASIGTKYKWSFTQWMDIGIYEIWRDYDKEPHTVLISEYEKYGDEVLFHDLFQSEDWDVNRGKDGKISSDVNFCCALWVELGLKEKVGENFQPKHIRLEGRNSLVFRRDRNTVMMKRYGGGDEGFHVDEAVDISLARPENSVERKSFETL